MTQRLVNQIHKTLIKNSKTVAVAESCTGGLLSALLTRSPGSSRYFILGLVTYSNQMKNKVLRVPIRLIERKGAVSREVALLMAESARKLSGADFGVSITGIAGPTGGSPRKPLGTVFIAVDSKENQALRKFCFRGNRGQVRNRAALKALEMLYESIHSD